MSDVITQAEAEARDALLELALAAAQRVLDDSGFVVAGTVLITELNGRGVSIVSDLEHPAELPVILGRAAYRAFGLA